MEIIIKNLVPHKYEENEILYNTSPNCLKDDYFDINREDGIKHPYASDIQISDLVVEAKSDTDSFMYFFVIIDVAQMGNKRYVIKKVIIDDNLSEKCIREFTKHILTTFVNGDTTTKDYIFTDKQFPFYEHTKVDIMPLVIDSIIDQFKITKYGWEQSDKGKKLLGRINH